MDSSSTEVVTEAAALLRLIETDSDSGDESSAINQYAVKMPLVLLESVLSDGFHKDAEACSVITGIDGATFRSRMFDFFLGIFFSLHVLSACVAGVPLCLQVRNEVSVPLGHRLFPSAVSLSSLLHS